MHRALECSSSERGPPVGAPGHESTQPACFAHALSMQHPFSCQMSAASAFGDFCVHMLYLTFCDPMDCSPLGSSVHGISQARILEGLPFPTPGHLPDPGIKPTSLVLFALAGGWVLYHCDTWEAPPQNMLWARHGPALDWSLPAGGMEDHE